MTESTNPEIRSRYNHHLREYREGKITDHKLIRANEDIGNLLDELREAKEEFNRMESAWGKNVREKDEEIYKLEAKLRKFVFIRPRKSRANQGQIK